MDKKTDKSVKEYKQKIKKEFPDSKIILFGSRARGDNLEESDYDIIIISKEFKNIKTPKRLEKVYKHWNNKLNADIIPYTPEEYENWSQYLTIARKAKKEGIVI